MESYKVIIMYKNLQIKIPLMAYVHYLDLFNELIQIKNQMHISITSFYHL